CGSGCTASTPTVSTGSVTGPGRVGHAGSTRPSGARWSPWVPRAPTGRLVRQADGTLAAVDPQQPGVWTLDALVQAAHELGIAIERSQVRRILLEEGARWRHPRSSTASPAPEFVPKGPESSTSIPTRRPGGRW